MSGIDRIEAGPWLLYAPSLMPLLLAVARAVHEEGYLAGSDIDKAMMAVEQYADEKFPEKECNG